MLTPKAVFLLGREKMKDGPSKGQFVPVVDRAIEMEKIQKLYLSPRQDDFVIIFVVGGFLSSKPTLQANPRLAFRFHSRLSLSQL